MTERYMPVVDLNEDWVIIEVVPGVTRSVHAEDLTDEQVARAYEFLTPRQLRQLRRMRNG